MWQSSRGLAAFTFCLIGAGFPAVPTQAATCIGHCGQNTGTIDGDVVPAPGILGNYNWISSQNGVVGAARLAGYGGNAANGSELLTDKFVAAVGQTVSFDLNYITSDGADYADYSFVQLINRTTGTVSDLFSARTTPAGNIVPGQDMPAITATLSPASVVITPGLTNWSPLGASSGTCYDLGCGLTGWVHATVDVLEAGTYQLRFGAANSIDRAWDSGLAFSSLLIDETDIGITLKRGSSVSDPLLPDSIGPHRGEFNFDFEAEDGNFIFVDPIVAVGYEFNVISGPNILSAIFPELGDLDGYEIYLLSDLVNPLATHVMGKSHFDFGPGGVNGFQIRGIDSALGLDPNNTLAFVTALLFAVGSGTTNVQLTETPLSADITPGPIPEPASWAMMIGGFALAGAALRRRRVAPGFA